MPNFIHKMRIATIAAAPFHEGGSGQSQRAGLLASEYTERSAFPSCGQWRANVLFSYSGGTATELHRLLY